MKLSGNDYAPVDERLRVFHETNKNGSIQNSIQFLEGKLIQATCKLIPDVKTPERFFTASSYGELGKQKAYEKLETIAVGRALAFAGFLADGKIASVEEIEAFEENQKAQQQVKSSVSSKTTSNSLKSETAEAKIAKGFIYKLENNLEIDIEKANLWLFENQEKISKTDFEKITDLLIKKQNQAANTNPTAPNLDEITDETLANFAPIPEIEVA